MSVNEIARPRAAPNLLRPAAGGVTKKSSRSMRRAHLKGAGNITTIGIDLGKNTFHLVGLDKRGLWVACRRLLRLPADRDDVCRRLPDLFIGQDISPGRHTEALLLSAIGNRLKDVLGVKPSLRQIDAASAIFPMTMGTLLGQKEIMARRNLFRVLEIRNVFFRGRHLSNEDSRDDHHHKSARHGKHPDCFARKAAGNRPLFVARLAYFGSLKAIKVEAAGIFASWGNNGGSRIAA
jgi:hypothetical protein